MNGIVLLDTSVLGIVTNPNATQRNLECRDWLNSLLLHDYLAFVPEIADYELRRELIRAGKVKGLARLDELADLVGYLPLSTETMRLAAALWAESRNRWRPTASFAALDADVILAAQARLIGQSLGESVVVATSNVDHLSQFVDARAWEQIVPS